MSGHFGDLSPEQEESLKELKNMLLDVLTSDYDDRYLLRFLRARNFDLRKTEDMFRKHVSWRKRNPKKFLLEEYKPPEILQKYISTPFLGYDKDGCFVICLRTCEYDIKGLFSCFRAHEVNQYAAYVLDKHFDDQRKYNEKLGRVVETGNLVFDLENLKLKQLLHKPVLDSLISLLRMIESNYPEILKRAYVVNIPYFFQWLFSIVKSVANEVTLQKIRIYGEDFEDELLKEICPEILPRWLGGTRTDPDGDPDCPSLASLPGPIPEKYYLKNQCKLQKDADNVHQCYLRRRSRQEMPMFVDEPESTIVWRVECPDSDINVGLFYKNRDSLGSQYGESKLEEVMPFTKCGGNFGPVCGNYINRKPGIYVLVFDNTFSMIRSKHVLFTADVLPPVDVVVPKEDDIIENYN